MKGLQGGKSLRVERIEVIDYQRDSESFEELPANMINLPFGLIL